MATTSSSFSILDVPAERRTSMTTVRDLFARARSFFAAEPAAQSAEAVAVRADGTLMLCRVSRRGCRMVRRATAADLAAAGVATVSA